MIVFIFLLTFLSGFLLTKLFLPEIRSKMLVFGYSLGMGISIEAILMFAVLNVSYPFQKSVFLGIEVLIIIFLCLYLFRRMKGSINFQNNVSETDSEKASFCKKYLIFFIAAMLFVTAELFFHFAKEPYGSWDGMFIWNLHAKFLYVLYENSMNYKDFFNLVMEWSHIDYPLLLPLYNYKNHLLYNSYNILLPVISAFVIFLASVFTLTGSIKEIVNMKNALIAGIVLLATKAFVWESMTQCADVILGLYILLSAVSLCLAEKYNNNKFVSFAFFFAASAAFCKNEGILFFCVFVFLYLLFIKKNVKFILIGCLIPLICVLYSKVFLYGKSDLFSDRSLIEIIGKLCDFSGYKLIVLHYIGNTENLINLVILFVLGVLSGQRQDVLSTKSKLILVSLTVLIFAGYFVIYLISPNDLNWHLASSSMRLTVHYTPLIIYLIFAVFNCCDKDRLNLAE